VKAEEEMAIIMAAVLLRQPNVKDKPIASLDGDTLDINNVRVRLALINTPERGQSGHTEAIDFVQSVCGVGTTALVDEDDGQKEGSFDRVIGLCILWK
jgi:endonuclease YncB( thermonuclease family)